MQDHEESKGDDPKVAQLLSKLLQSV